MQWHTTHEAMELVKQRQQELLQQAEMHRLAKEARDQRRQQPVTEEPAPRVSRLARALDRALHPAR